MSFSQHQFILILIFLLCSIILGYILASLLANSKRQVLQERINYFSNESNRLLMELKENKEEKQALFSKNQQLQNELSETKKTIELLKERLKTGELTEEKQRQQFTLLAAEVFDATTKKWAEQNHTNLSQIINPLKERITQFEKKVEDTNLQSVKRISSLREYLDQLRRLNETISEEANNLTKALKGDNKIQGNWGELILERVLEKSGLTLGREYSRQQSLTDENGQRKQPDVIINLPDGKRMIIDSKVSLTAYEKFVSATDKNEREHQLKQHVASLRKHIKQLAQKKYYTLHEQKSPDFVLLFIPIETAFSIALQKHERLYTEAFDQQIIVVTPSTLLATLKTIDTWWQNDKQRKNSLEIAKAAGLLYDKFVAFIQDLEQIGYHINKMNDVYDEAHKKLTTGKGNLISKADKLIQLGVKAKKTLPNSIQQTQETEHT